MVAGTILNVSCSYKPYEAEIKAIDFAHKSNCSKDSNVLIPNAA